MRLEDLALGGENVRPAPHVPVIRPACGDLESDLLTAAAHHQLRPRLLYGTRHERGVVELVVLALEGRALLRPEEIQHLARFVETAEAIGHRVEGNAVGGVLVLLPARAHSADE